MITLKPGIYLRSTLNGDKYPADSLAEYGKYGESLELYLPDIDKAKICKGATLWERFADFMPFEEMDPGLSLGEGNTPLVKAGAELSELTGIPGLYLKNETANPTWSFKDRGSLTCIAMSKAMNESLSLTISTGNMGHSLAAYGAHAGIRVLVFVPDYTPQEKTAAIKFHGATVVRIPGDYSRMKRRILKLAEQKGLRIVSGNGPYRVEGYKMTAFELYEQFRGDIPEYIAVPTSACGHIRGLFKGFLELHRAGYLFEIPKMIVVQAENNSPVVSAIKQRKKEIIPFKNVHTVAEAISTGNPPGAEEILDKAYLYKWPAESVTESEILESQKMLAGAGFFVEPAAAASLYALKKLRAAKKINKSARVILMLTGAGFKDMSALKYQRSRAKRMMLKQVPDYLDSLRSKV